VIVEGHCGQLPASMVPGMRAAQEVRDAAMTEEDGTAPKAAERRNYDLVIVTPRTERPDPCAQLRR